MRWLALETNCGKALVIDTWLNRVVAYVNSEPFKGMLIANMIAAAPDMQEALNEVSVQGKFSFIDDLLLKIESNHYIKNLPHTQKSFDLSADLIEE